MSTGVSPKREREYKKLVGSFKQENRYKGREEEVAARIVNKQRKELDETKGQKHARSQGQSDDKGLPIKDYNKLTIPQIDAQLKSLTASQKRKIRSYEMGHKHRKGVLERLDRQLSH